MYLVAMHWNSYDNKIHKRVRLLIKNNCYKSPKNCAWAVKKLEKSIKTNEISDFGKLCPAIGITYKASFQFADYWNNVKPFPNDKEVIWVVEMLAVFYTL